MLKNSNDYTKSGRIAVFVDGVNVAFAKGAAGKYAGNYIGTNLYTIVSIRISEIILIIILPFNKISIILLNILNLSCKNILILFPKTKRTKLNKTTIINIIVETNALNLNLIYSFSVSTSYAALKPLHKAKKPFPADHNVKIADIVIVPTDLDCTSFTIPITASFNMSPGIMPSRI